jgi:hypothetical protein
MENLYCISGIIDATKKFARDEESQAEFEKEIKELHIPESLNLITEETLISLFSRRVMGHCLGKMVSVVVSEYKLLGYESSQKCFSCGVICH